MRIADDIKQSLPDFIELCRIHQVKSIYAFGSSITPHFNPDTSDIDLVVKIDNNNPLERGEMLLSLWDQLEDFFKRKVDLLTENSIKNPFLKRQIDSTKVLIYDGTSQKSFS